MCSIQVYVCYVYSQVSPIHRVDYMCVSVCLCVCVWGGGGGDSEENVKTMHYRTSLKKLFVHQKVIRRMYWKANKHTFAKDSPRKKYIKKSFFHPHPPPPDQMSRPYVDHDIMLSFCLSLSYWLVLMFELCNLFTHFREPSNNCSWCWRGGWAWCCFLWGGRSRISDGLQNSGDSCLFSRFKDDVVCSTCFWWGSCQGTVSYSGP